MAVIDGGGNVGMKKTKAPAVTSRAASLLAPVVAPAVKPPIGRGADIGQGYKDVMTPERDKFAAIKAAEADYAAKYGPGSQLIPQAAPRSGSGYGSGSGSGGGGGSATPVGPVPAYDPAMLDALYAQVDQAGQTDRATAKGAYDGLDQYMANLGNPYAHIQPAAQAQVDPSQLAALLQSQGGGDAGLRAQAGFLQAQNGSQAAAGDRMAQLMSANQQSWNQGSRTAGQIAAKQTDGDLMSQLLAMRAAIQLKKSVMK